MKKLITARVHVKQGLVDEFIQAAKALVTASRAEAGCIAYEYLHSPDNGHQFLFLERWKDQAAIDSHFASEHFVAFGATLGRIAASKPEIVIFDIKDEKAV
ncbi:MAG: antibiotic biosynthesis monooxygenase [Puniceicoccales bacterium]|jgi:quinol monooxygenase YgiN|nr:antibiotic biosynthesis monooxygenase [Puniceicoccales bacterium]